MLSSSLNNFPDIMDGIPPKNYKPKNPIRTPSYYPQELNSCFDDARLYSRIDPDTLFYVFYYKQETYQQFLAAKALKDQSWRFHKQYQTWFQRHEEPKTITEEFEQGTYRFFDYESTWYVFLSFSKHTVVRCSSITKLCPTTFPFFWCLDRTTTLCQLSHFYEQSPHQPNRPRIPSTLYMCLLLTPVPS